MWVVVVVLTAAWQQSERLKGGNSEDGSQWRRNEKSPSMTTCPWPVSIWQRPPMGVNVCVCVCVGALSLCMWVSPHTGAERECVCFAVKSEDSQIFFFVFYFSNAGVDFTIIRFTVQHFVNCSNLTCTLTHTHNTHNTTQARRVLTLVIKNGSVHM